MASTTTANTAYIYDGMSAWEKGVKRVADVIISAFCLVIFSPLFLVCYLAIIREYGQPAIYKQERIGKGGKPFYIYKFRSMKMDAEKDGPRLFDKDNDDRLTKTGKFLREHHLDELPQLWNVLIGDMSIVGPRPERKYYIDQIMKNDPRYEFIYEMRPGLTSEATIYNGYTDTMEKMLIRLNMDIHYLENRSLWLDFCIIIKTVISIISGKKF